MYRRVAFLICNQLKNPFFWPPPACRVPSQDAGSQGHAAQGRTPPPLRGAEWGIADRAARGGGLPPVKRPPDLFFVVPFFTSSRSRFSRRPVFVVGQASKRVLIQRQGRVLGALGGVEVRVRGQAAAGGEAKGGGGGRVGVCVRGGAAHARAVTRARPGPSAHPFPPSPSKNMLTASCTPGPARESRPT